MQRQDEYRIARDDMLRFIARLLSLADLAIRIVAGGRRVDDRLLASFRRSEHAMLVLLAGILRNVDTQGQIPGLEKFVQAGEPVDRQAEMLRISASYRQIALSLALILSMFPRAFRDRTRTGSFDGCEAEPEIPTAAVATLLVPLFVLRVSARAPPCPSLQGGGGKARLASCRLFGKDEGEGRLRGDFRAVVYRRDCPPRSFAIHV